MQLGSVFTVNPPADPDAASDQIRPELVTSHWRSLRPADLHSLSRFCSSGIHLTLFSQAARNTRIFRAHDRMRMLVFTKAAGSQLEPDVVLRKNTSYF